MGQRLKHMIVAGAAVLVLGGAGSATLAASAHATDNNDQNDQGDNHQDNTPNNPWRILEFVKNHINEIKKGGPLLHEHAAVTVSLLRAQVLNGPDVTALTNAEDLNAQQIADTIEMLYPGSHAKFLDLWRKHILYYTDYVNAKKANNLAGQAAAKQHLKDFNDQVATLLDNISDKLHRATLTQQLQVHTDGTLAVIDAMFLGDWTKVYTLAHAGFEHMTDISVSLLFGAKLK